MAPDSEASKPFEFSADHNKVFRSAGYWMGIMGRLGVLFGALACVAYSMPFDMIGLAIAAIWIICSVLTIRAAAAFRKVDQSTGNDVSNVLMAVDNLASLYRIQAILIGILAAVFLATVASATINEYFLKS